MARLDRERPDLRDLVVKGQLSAHAAMVQAGFAKPRFTVFGDDPDVIVKAMRRNLPPELLAAVVDRLPKETP